VKPRTILPHKVMSVRVYASHICSEGDLSNVQMESTIFKLELHLYFSSVV